MLHPSQLASPSKCHDQRSQGSFYIHSGRPWLRSMAFSSSPTGPLLSPLIYKYKHGAAERFWSPFALHVSTFLFSSIQHYRKIVEGRVLEQEVTACAGSSLLFCYFVLAVDGCRCCRNGEVFTFKSWSSSVPTNWSIMFFVLFPAVTSWHDEVSPFSHQVVIIAFSFFLIVTHRCSKRWPSAGWESSV